jgi:hypothetical protein
MIKGLNRLCVSQYCIPKNFNKSVMCWETRPGFQGSCSGPPGRYLGNLFGRKSCFLAYYEADWIFRNSKDIHCQRFPNSLRWYPMFLGESEHLIKSNLSSSNQSLSRQIKPVFEVTKSPSFNQMRLWGSQIDLIQSNLCLRKQHRFRQIKPVFEVAKSPSFNQTRLRGTKIDLI